jgi:UDP:flavonoid glycosyltransferase YjiC (YdhE family)
MRILFACLAADGHFNPLTGIAVHLARTGHDVRWYTGASMAPRLQRLGIAHEPFDRATEVTGETLPELFPERASLRGPALIRFDGEKIMLSNVAAFVEDVRRINETFPFDLLFCDALFFGARLIRQVLGKPVFTLAPWSESPEDAPNLPPWFVGRKPARTAVGRTIYRGMKLGMNRTVYDPLRTIYNRTLAEYGEPPITWPILEESVRVADRAFFNGVPEMAYPRAHRDPAVVHIGACLPHREPGGAKLPVELGAYPRTVLVSQGTIDNVDPGKLMIPTIEALSGSPCLVLVATGGHGTERLRRNWARPNVVISDWIDFDAVLPHVDAFVCNGGSGSLLLSLSHGVPVVAAGTREGKNDNNAHVDYLGVGINLHTEKPSARRIRRATARVLGDPHYRDNAARLREVLRRYDPLAIIDAHLAELQVTR